MCDRIDFYNNLSGRYTSVGGDGYDRYVGYIGMTMNESWTLVKFGRGAYMCDSRAFANFDIHIFLLGGRVGIGDGCGMNSFTTTWTLTGLAIHTGA